MTSTTEIGAQVEWHLEQALQLMQGANPGQGGLLTSQDQVRVAKHGLCAHLHEKFIHDHGSMTQADSIDIRRKLYGPAVQSTANLFGKAGEGALFYRGVPYAQRVKPSDPILMTDEGRRIAKLYRKAHGIADL